MHNLTNHQPKVPRQRVAFQYLCECHLRLVYWEKHYRWETTLLDTQTELVAIRSGLRIMSEVPLVFDES
jgi:hypothetical protein